MKYFTPAWHSGEGNDEADNAFEEYKKHLKLLAPQLTPEVQELATNVSLHDGLLWKIVVNKEQSSLLLAFRCGDLQVGYFDLELHYLQVLFLPSVKENLAQLVVNHRDKNLHTIKLRSEALYDELDTEEGLFVHRILFYSRRNYREFTLRFKQIHLQKTPREDRYSIAVNGEEHAGNQILFLC